MPDPTHRSGTPFDAHRLRGREQTLECASDPYAQGGRSRDLGITPDLPPVAEDEEELPGHPPRREGSPLLEPDTTPGAPPDSVPPGPGSPA
jgi:hypothetical protein